MIFSKDILFIHVPKTGGMSVSHYLVDVLPRPLYYVQPEIDPDIVDEGVVQIRGKRHATLAEAVEVVRDYGFDLESFPLILAAIRNPYALEVSRFASLLHNHPWMDPAEVQLATNNDFETYARLSGYHSRKSLDRYLLFEGEMPSNLRVVRFENLANGVREELRSIGVDANASFPWENRSEHSATPSYYTAAAEEIVYAKYRWIFDQEFYERMDTSRLSDGSATAEPWRDRADRERWELREEIGRLVGSSVPQEAGILVVSKGDDELLRLAGRSARHFPQDDEGYYTGSHPADSQEAIDQLEALRGQGADFLLLPRPSFWWLDHYDDFARYLQERYPLVVQHDICRIFDLRDGVTNTIVDSRRGVQDGGVPCAP